MVPTKLPASLAVPAEPAPARAPQLLARPPPVISRAGDAVEFDRVVRPSGNLQVVGKQLWFGPARSGITVTFWADTDVIHLMIAGALVKSVRSHLSVTDLAAPLRQSGRPASPPPLPPVEAAEAVELDRTVNRAGTVSLLSASGPGRGHPRRP